MADQGKLRFQHPERRQIHWQAVSLDQLLPHDHEARLVWAYVDQLDVTPLLEKQRQTGHPTFNDARHGVPKNIAYTFVHIKGVETLRRVAG